MSERCSCLSGCCHEATHLSPMTSFPALTLREAHRYDKDADYFRVAVTVWQPDCHCDESLV